VVPLVLSTTGIIHKPQNSSLKALGFNFELDNLSTCIHRLVWYPNEWRNLCQRCNVTNNQIVHTICDYRPVPTSSLRYSDCGHCFQSHKCAAYIRTVCNIQYSCCTAVCRGSLRALTVETDATATGSLQTKYVVVGV
jgi:hypothetical protein